jgi:hypothetical protein
MWDYLNRQRQGADQGAVALMAIVKIILIALHPRVFPFLLVGLAVIGISQSVHNFILVPVALAIIYAGAVMRKRGF